MVKKISYYEYVEVNNELWKKFSEHKEESDVHILFNYLFGMNAMESDYLSYILRALCIYGETGETTELWVKKQFIIALDDDFRKRYKKNRKKGDTRTWAALQIIEERVGNRNILIDTNYVEDIVKVMET